MPSRVSTSLANLPMEVYDVGNKNLCAKEYESKHTYKQ